MAPSRPGWVSARLMFTLVIWDPGVRSTCTMAHKMQSTHPERTQSAEGDSLMQVRMATDCIPTSTRGHGRRAQGDSLMRVRMATGASQQLLGVTARRGLRGTALCGFGWPQVHPNVYSGSRGQQQGRQSCSGDTSPGTRRTWNPATILTNHVLRGWQKLCGPRHTASFREGQELHSGL